MNEYKNVLVFCAHPDDEIIGCGGTIAKLSEKGATITVVMFTLGETGYTQPGQREEFSQVREREKDRYDHILGISNRIVLGKPCQDVVNDVDTYRQCIRICREVTPDVVFTHSPADRHRDHRAVSEITTEACWKASEPVLADYGKPWNVQHVFFFEIFELFSQPSLIVDITDTLPAKRRAMETQASQLLVLQGIQQYIEGLAAARGFLGKCKYGEAFLRSSVLPEIAAWEHGLP